MSATIRRMTREEFESKLANNSLVWDHNTLTVRDREMTPILRTRNIGWLDTWMRIYAELHRRYYIARNS